MAESVPTIKVRHKEHDVEININKEDFDPEVHEKVESRKRLPDKEEKPVTPARKTLSKKVEDEDDED